MYRKDDRREGLLEFMSSLSGGMARSSCTFEPFVYSSSDL